MSHRHTLTVTCDKCGQQVSFEMFDEASWTYTTDLPLHLERAGWTRRRYEDTSPLRQMDICPACISKVDP